MLSGPKNVSTAENRVAGYRRALVESGSAIDEELIYCGELNQAAGFEMMEKASRVFICKI